MKRRRHLVVALAVGVLALGAAPSAGASARLTARAAKHALRVNLARGFGIHHVHATCQRRSRSKFSCRWRGVRRSTHYRGRAVVAKSGHTTTVQLSQVHRA